MSILITFLISLLLGALVTPWLIKLCIKMDWTDQPNHRKVHTLPIPRLGGLVFLPCTAISFILVTLVMNYRNNVDTTIQFSTMCMVVGAMAIYLVGLIDDVQELKASTKFFIQLAAALIFPLCNLLINDLHGFLWLHELPFYISYPFTVYVILLITNAMNLIDGIDGLASGLSILILAAFTYLFAQGGVNNFVYISAATLGCVLAFFCFNMFGKVGKKKIFMGDSGSLFLGYIISYLAIKYQMIGSMQTMTMDGSTLLASYTLVIIPTFDVIRVAATRKFNHLGVFTPDKTHIHHRLMAMGLTMRQTLWAILTLFCVMCALNYLLYQMSIPLTFIVLCDILLYSSIIWFSGMVKIGA